MAVEHADAVGGDGLVVIADVLVDESQARAAERVGAEQGAGGHAAGAFSSERAVIGLADAACRDGERGGIDPHLMCAADQGVVARQAGVAIAQGEVAQVHGLADADVLVGHAAVTGQAQVLTLDQAGQAENAGAQRAGAVIATHTRQAHRGRGDSQTAGQVIDQIALLVRIQPGQVDVVRACVAGTDGAAAIDQLAGQTGRWRTAVAEAAVASIGCAVIGLAEAVGGHCQRRHEAAQHRHAQAVVHDPGAGHVPSRVVGIVGAGRAGEVGQGLHLGGGHANTGAAGRCRHTGAGDVPETVDMFSTGAADQPAPPGTDTGDQSGGIAVDDHAGGSHADQAASPGVAFDAAGGVGAGDMAGGDRAHQAARTGTARHSTRGVAIGDMAAGDGPDQAACARTAGNATGGIAVVDIAGGAAAQQAANRSGDTVVDIAGGVAVADAAAGHGADQTTGAGRAGDRAGGIAVEDITGAAAAEQRASACTTDRFAADQPDVLDHGQGAGSPDQPDAGGAGQVDDQVAYLVAQAVQGAGETGDGGEAGSAIPARACLGVDVGAERVVVRHIAADALQIGAADATRRAQAVDDGERFGQAVSTQRGAEVLPGRQIDCGIDLVAGGIAFGIGALPVKQGQAAAAARGADRLVDVDVAVGVQGQAVVAAPVDRVIDENVAIGPADPVGSLNHDVVTGQRSAERGSADVATAGGDGEIGRVDQPGSRLALRRGGADSCRIGDLDLGGAGLDKPAIAAIRRRGIQAAIDIGGARGHAAQQDDAAFTVFDGARFDHTGVVDHAGQQRIFRARTHQHGPAISMNHATVLGQIVQQALVDLHLDQAAVLKGQGGRAARTQCHGALWHADAALVAHAVAQQRNIAAAAV